MREIVHVQAGQCGNQIGAKFWEVIADEVSLQYELILPLMFERKHQLPNQNVVSVYCLKATLFESHCTYSQIMSVV